MDDQEFKERVMESISEIKFDLREHMRRTKLSEERHDRQDEINLALIQKLEPIERAHHAWIVVGKVATYLSPIVVGIIVAWLKAKLWP